VALRLGDTLLGLTAELRYEPTAKRVRGALAGETVLDTKRALLVWEPHRVVPTYAAPLEDLACELVASAAGADGRSETVPFVSLGADGPLVIESADFAMHTIGGEALTIRAGAAELVGAAFRPADPDLAGYVVLDFDAFEWREEEEPIRGHPRDPFHRVDVRQSARSVRIEHEGTLLAESSRPRLVFETKLPPRFYLPREDVRLDLLRASSTRTTCAYKGEACYFSLAPGQGSVADVCWSYEQPLPDAAELAGFVCFFDERVGVTVDGEIRERPRTPWS
jgi:uncharacterized protein (DUF427 family)